MVLFHNQINEIILSGFYFSISQLLVKYLKNQDIEEGQKILKVFEEGEDVFPHSDGTWSIKVTKWEDAYKVTPEQYAEQLKSLDDTGNFGISQMNEAVESTWRERGLIAGDGLLSKNAKERNDTAKAVLRYYKNKFRLGKTKIHLNFGNWSNIPDGRTNSGFIMQSEKYSRNNAGKSLTKYTIIHKGELAYNHGALKNKPYG